MPSLQISLVTAFIISFLFFKLFRSGRREKYLPPGPPTYPVLGNIPSLPLEGLHYKLTEWANLYGEIYSLKLGSTTTIILNSMEAIHQIIEVNSALTSDRPPNHIADTVTGEHQPYILLTRYSNKWRNQRRAIHDMLRTQSCPNYVPVQNAEVYQFAMELLTNPKNFVQYVRRMTFSTIITSVHGLRVPRSTSSFCIEFHHLVDSWLSLLRPGSQMPVDIFPILKYIPERFAPWKKVSKALRRKQKSFSYNLLDMVERRISRGEGNGCFMEVLLEKGSTWGLDRESINYLGQVLLDGASDTTSGMIQTFILLMTAYPEVLRKAQQEMDTVIGMDRVPTLEDINNLPYLAAALLEANRLKTLSPVGVPHYTSGPVKYNDYLIPKDSTLVLNMWAIFHDEKMFPNAEAYNPERFINNPETAKVIDYVFGAGRRICPGIHFAKNSVHLIVMTLLWGFSINKSCDAAGNEIEVDVNAFHQRISMEPKPFDCEIKPRSTKHVEILRSEFHASKRDVRAFEVDMPEDDVEYLNALRKEHL